MKNYKKTMIKCTLKSGLTFYILLTLMVVGVVGGNAAASGNNKTKRIGANSAQAKETEKILSAAAKKMKTSKDAFQKNLVANRFTPEQNVFLPSALAVDFKKRTATLPLYTGIGPGGQPTYFIITEAADFEVAKRFGINYSPKLIYGKDTEGIQKVSLNKDGVIKFAGDVDFKPERILVAGDSVIPPARFEPGAIADDKYSPLIQLPSGMILNTPIIANGTGTHDHLVNIDYEKGTVEFELLDGYQGGQQYYYHLVTESNDKLAATIERGVYTPRLGKLPAFGKDRLGDKSTLLGFAPTANGETGRDNPERQGLNSTVLDGDAYDPINVFPIDPDNNKRDGNNYSPMWDAHIYVWTDAAIKDGKRKRIKSFEELARHFKDGNITDAPINTGEANSFVAGLKPSNAIINCPVIAQPVNP